MNPAPSTASPNFHELNFSPREELAVRRRTVLPTVKLPDHAVALLMQEQEFKVVRGNKIRIEVNGVKRDYTHVNSLVCQAANEGRRFLVSYALDFPEAIFALTDAGAFLETIPLKGTVKWFDSPATSQAIAEKGAKIQRARAVLEQVHAPDTIARAERATRNLQKIRGTEAHEAATELDRVLKRAERLVKPPAPAATEEEDKRTRPLYVRTYDSDVARASSLRADFARGIDPDAKASNARPGSRLSKEAIDSQPSQPTSSVPLRGGDQGVSNTSAASPAEPTAIPSPSDDRESYLARQRSASPSAPDCDPDATAPSSDRFPKDHLNPSRPQFDVGRASSLPQSDKQDACPTFAAADRLNTARTRARRQIDRNISNERDAAAVGTRLANLFTGRAPGRINAVARPKSKNGQVGIAVLTAKFARQTDDRKPGGLCRPVLKEETNNGSGDYRSTDSI
jgi:hypothetical protein